MMKDILNDPKLEFLQHVPLLTSSSQPPAEVCAERRGFLKAGAIVTAAVSLWWPREASAVRTQNFAAGRELALHNVHTGDTFRGEYWYNGRYIPDAFREIKSVMRDYRTGDIFPIDPRLMDVLFVLQNRMDNFKPFDVFSGYRSPETNAKLRRASYGVAKHSLHMQGQAIDLRLPGTSLKNLRRQAMNLRAGGVGYYPSSSFVHLDTGRVREW